MYFNLVNVEGEVSLYCLSKGKVSLIRITNKDGENIKFHIVSIFELFI